MKAISSNNVYYQGKLAPKTILFDQGKIIDVIDNKTPHNSLEEHTDFNDLYILPGLIDPHVHINEPGREHWEGFETATKAAAAGGFTTIIDMPLNSSPVTVNQTNLERKKKAAHDQLFIDVGFWGGVTSKSTLDEIERLIEQDVFGLKCFMIDSGLDEFSPIEAEQLIPVMQLLKKHDKPLLAHAEMAIEESTAIDHRYQSFLASRSDEMELKAIELLIQACEKARCKTHIVHLSTAKALARLNKIKKSLPITVETAPHYLFFAAEEIADKATEFKCCPPIRSLENQNKLWEGMCDQIIDFIASDHSPCPLEMKHKETGSFKTSWGGIASLQISFLAIFTLAIKKNVAFSNLMHWFAEKPSLFLNLNNQKGFIEKNYDADFVIFDPKATETIKAQNLFHKNKITPYEDKTVQGKILKTYLRGDVVYENGTHRKKSGQIIKASTRII